MRLVEFYNPEFDDFVNRQKGDTRKAKLTLEQLSKLRRYREVKKAEQIGQDKFAKVMYSAPAPDSGL